MADSEGRVLKFVTEKELEHLKESHGARPEDGTVTVTKPLHEILKENKDKKDAEFAERFKHKPQKALDDDEVEFLDEVEKRRRQQEKQWREDEERQLSGFQAAVFEMSYAEEETQASMQKPTDTKRLPAKEQMQQTRKRPSQATIISRLVVRPSSARQSLSADSSTSAQQRAANVTDKKARLVNEDKNEQQSEEKARGGLGGLVSYGSSDDEDEADDDRDTTR